MAVKYVDLPATVSWAKIGYDADDGQAVVFELTDNDKSICLDLNPEAARSLARALTHAAARLSMAHGYVALRR